MTQETPKLYKPSSVDIHNGDAKPEDRFVETGEFRLPKKGEWYGCDANHNHLAFMAAKDFNTIRYRILKPGSPRARGPHDRGLGGR